MRALLFASLALGLAIAGSAAAAPLPPLPEPPALPDLPLPELPGAHAGCLGLTIQLGTAGFSIDPPACSVNDVAAPDADPVGAPFPALPEVPLPALPALPELPVPI